MTIDLDELEARLTTLASEHYGGAADAYAEAVMLVRQMRAEALPEARANHMAAMHHGETTQAMRRAALPRSGSLRARIVEALRGAGGYGLTDDDMEVEFGRAHQTVSAARRGLVEQGWVQPLVVGGVPIRQNTRAGNPATVWTLTGHARLRLSMANR